MLDDEPSDHVVGLYKVVVGLCDLWEDLCLEYASFTHLNYTQPHPRVEADYVALITALKRTLSSTPLSEAGLSRSQRARCRSGFQGLSAWTT